MAGNDGSALCTAEEHSIAISQTLSVSESTSHAQVSWQQPASSPNDRVKVLLLEKHHRMGTP